MFSTEDLVCAYKKAKVDIYYSSNGRLEDIADYEENLISNISRLQERISGKDESWVSLQEFTGGWELSPKSIDFEQFKASCNVGESELIFSSPSEEWKYLCEKNPKNKPKAEFRVMACCSLDFYVLSTLWILKVGALFDAKLSRNSYGNRLRRKQKGNDVDPHALGTFCPYLKPFRDWRDNGVASMSSALDSKMEVIAITADITSFYHELNPDFMLDVEFMKHIEVELDDDQKKLHRLFINALKSWADITPLKKGLPVGLPAAAVIANMALIDFDRVMEREIVPIYYGRYVDDVLVVLENGSGFRSVKDIWDWVFSRSSGILNWNDGLEVCFKPDYLSNRGDGRDSLIRFSNKKNKVFLLNGDSGRAMIDTIARQIYERASEWRAVPRLPKLASDIGADLLVATQSDGESADSLREADALTMRRAAFAIKLRDFEAYERDLLPSAWKDHRTAFFDAFIRHVMVLPKFFDLFVYLPRIIRLATSCEDFYELRKIIDALDNICTQVQDNCEIEIKAYCNNKPSDDFGIGDEWRYSIFQCVLESILAAFPPKISQKGKLLWDSCMEDWHNGKISVWKYHFRDFSIRGYQAAQARLFSFDLAHMPFRFLGLPAEIVAQRGIPFKDRVKKYAMDTSIFEKAISNGYSKIANWMGFDFPLKGMVFATRPFSMAELYLICRDAYSPRGLEAMKEVVLATRGFNLGDRAPCLSKDGAVLCVHDENNVERCNIAVASWQTSINSWAASVVKRDDPDVERYARLCQLVDGVLSQPHCSRYFVLPELSIPPHWFLRFSRKLHAKGISLIAGVEYLHAKRNRVRNQIWAALSYDGLGFPSMMIYRQDKQRPALHEEQELRRLGGLEMKPEKVWKSPPIIQHGGLRFSLLVCSELTNISYRSTLRGQVDVLFVLEWNQDTDTFNSLVESAALDIHAYVIQCNDRQYGDSRIRAPFKDAWKRDILRLKGGVTDYCAVGEIDVQSLRRFQSSYRSPDKPFKPVPDGFKIGYARKVLQTVG